MREMKLNAKIFMNRAVNHWASSLRRTLVLNTIGELYLSYN